MTAENAVQPGEPSTSHDATQVKILRHMSQVLYVSTQNLKFEQILPFTLKKG